MEWSEPVSPELVLVDPELATRLREAARTELAPVLRIAAARAAPAPSARILAEPPVQSAPARHENGRLATAVIKLASGTAMTLIVLLALLPFLALLPPRQAPRIVDPSAQAFRPPKGWLAWPPDERADYYVVQILDATHLVHVTIPTEPMTLVPGGLRPDSYSWRVFAGYGIVDDNVRRGPIAQGSFSVPAD